MQWAPSGEHVEGRTLRNGYLVSFCSTFTCEVVNLKTMTIVQGKFQGYKRQLRESIQLAKLFWGRTLAHFNQASLSTDDGVGGLVPHCSASRDSSPCACVPVGTRHALPFFHPPTLQS